MPSEKIILKTSEYTILVINSFTSPTDAITNISIDLLVPFESQHFKPYTKE